MNDNTLSNSESKYEREDWKDLSPEELLGTLLHELRNPLVVMRGWTHLLANPEAKEHHQAAIEHIAFKLTQLEDIHKALGEYLREHTTDSKT